TPAAIHAQADSTLEWVKVEKIVLEGTRKTRPATILRELKIREGDSIPAPALSDVLERNRLLLLNLGIFTEATISVQEWTGKGTFIMKVKVTEAWFVYPVPILALSDRNFNVWWNEFDRSLKRLNYGLDWSQLNLTGRADVLKVKAQFGFTNRYELSYRSQGLNRRRTLGLEGSLAYSRAHELSYKTNRNKLDFLRVRESWQTEQLFAGLTFISRPKLFKSQTFTLEYRDNWVSDTIAKVLNPDYYLGGKNRQRHFSAVYSLTVDYRDFRPYPLKGWRGIVEVRKNGLLPSDDLQIFRAFAEWDQYFLLNKRLSLELVGKLRTSLPRKKPPQSNNQALGYGSNLVRGYDYYVVDGLDFALLRSSWHILLFDGNFNLGKAMPVKAYRKLPMRLYFAVNSDL
ncbi:MAG TPA: hypothetical protein DCF33_12765, partial [Saprospirales bacterium]|nr:hypothetical protein [Saprospirales bacterium]